MRTLITSVAVTALTACAVSTPAPAPQTSATEIAPPAPPRPSGLLLAGFDTNVIEQAEEQRLKLKRCLPRVNIVLVQ